MSEAKFTPGPWVYDDDRRHIVRHGDYDVCSLDIGWNESDQSELAEMDATAHLIAAAPELYDALVALFNSYKDLADSGDAGFWKIEDQPEGKQALAAIAKARGEV